MLILKLLATLTASAMVVLAQPIYPAPVRTAHPGYYEPDAAATAQPESVPVEIPAPPAIAAPPEPPPAPPAPPTTRTILVAAAGQEGVDPNLMLAVSWWESGWRQDQVSSEGAVGLMQVMPKTAAVVGPNWLHRDVDINNPADNALLGAALLGDLLHKYEPRTALAAYYQGEPAIASGRYAPDTWHYADSVLGLAKQFAGGWMPPGAA